MGLFKRKKKDSEQAEGEGEEAEETKKESEPTGPADEKLKLELTKIKTQLEGFAELRGANSERFTRISEQIGELRGMIMDTNKTIGGIEVTSTKAADLVESVQPQKLMVEIRKEDGKVEALKANIESNEALMKDLFSEMKKMRTQMNFYKGVEQVAKMNDDIKKDILQMKRTEATIAGHADKVETIFLEVNKKFAEFDKFNDVVKDMGKTFQQISQDFEKMKVKIEEKQEKKEFIELMNKFGEFEKHTTNLIKLLDEKSKNVKYDLKAKFDQVVKQLEKKFDTKLDVKDVERPPDKPLGEKMKGFFSKKKEEEKKEEEPDDGLGDGDDKPVDNLGAGDDKPVEQPPAEGEAKDGEKKEG
jgi:uncharacterized protein YoxC